MRCTLKREKNITQRENTRSARVRKRERKELHSSGTKRKKERVRLPSRKLPHVWCVWGGGVSAAVEKATGSRRERGEERAHGKGVCGDGDQTIAL